VKGRSSSETAGYQTIVVSRLQAAKLARLVVDLHAPEFVVDDSIAEALSQRPGLNSDQRNAIYHALTAQVCAHFVSIRRNTFLPFWTVREAKFVSRPSLYYRIY
jgi:hypothetical protein